MTAIKNALSGIEQKQLGLDLVTENAGDWMDYIIEKLRAFCKVRKSIGRAKFRMEEMRKLAEDLNWTMPHSANAWGALPRIALKAGLIRFTGEFVPAQSRRTHGHPVRVWEII